MTAAPADGLPEEPSVIKAGRRFLSDKEYDATVFAYIDLLRAKAQALQEQIACYRAVLDGVNYSYIDNMPEKGVEFCRAIGAETKARILDLKARAESAESALAAALERAERAENRCLELTLRVEALEESEKAGRKDMADVTVWVRAQDVHSFKRDADMLPFVPLDQVGGKP